MCWYCEHPEAAGQDYLRQVVLPTIERCGWMVQAVGGSPTRPPFAYTVGLTTWGLPELVVTGLGDREAAGLLNGVAGQVLVGGQRLGSSLEVVALVQPDAHLLVAGDLYGPALRGLQLVWADERGRWPWDAAFRDGGGGQPVLGSRGR